MEEFSQCTKMHQTMQTAKNRFIVSQWTSLDTIEAGSLMLGFQLRFFQPSKWWVDNVKIIGYTRLKKVGIDDEKNGFYARSTRKDQEQAA